jgi:hypothetical protein
LQKKNGKNNQGVLKDSERTIMRKKNKSEKWNTDTVKLSCEGGLISCAIESGAS